eukprot:1389226-Amorphochlora_amoeboformis.AAC.1
MHKHVHSYIHQLHTSATHISTFSHTLTHTYLTGKHREEICSGREDSRERELENKLVPIHGNYDIIASGFLDSQMGAVYAQALPGLSA